MPKGVGGSARSVSVGYAGTHGVIKPSGAPSLHLRHGETLGGAVSGPEYPASSKNSTRRESK